MEGWGLESRTTTDQSSGKIHGVVCLVLSRFTRGESEVSEMPLRGNDFPCGPLLARAPSVTLRKGKRAKEETVCKFLVANVPFLPGFSGTVMAIEPPGELGCL